MNLPFLNCYNRTFAHTGRLKSPESVPLQLA
jgi:hypothetical protein